MKKSNVMTKLMFVLVVLGMTFTSCSNDDSETNDTETQDTTEIARSSEVDDVAAIVGDIIIDSYEVQEASDAGRYAVQSALPDCVTITVILEQGFREITVDFGSEGCMIQGHLLKGQIILFIYKRS